MITKIAICDMVTMIIMMAMIHQQEQCSETDLLSIIHNIAEGSLNSFLDPDADLNHHQIQIN